MIFGFAGNMRGGKTLGMTAWAVLLSSMTGQKIYANYTINSPKFIRFKNWKDLTGVQNSIICFDEIGTALDSRNYKSRAQAEFTHLFAQMGKLGNTFLYATQRMHLVEKRVRDNTDYRIICRREWPGEALNQVWFDTQANAEMPIKVHTYGIPDPKKLYVLYDTYEKIESNMEWD